jgi:hypothetical protein
MARIPPGSSRLTTLLIADRDCQMTAYLKSLLLMARAKSPTRSQKMKHKSQRRELTP